MRLAYSSSAGSHSRGDSSRGRCCKRVTDAFCGQEVFQTSIENERVYLTPSSASSEIVDELPGGYLVTRVDRRIYPDLTPGTGLSFIRVLVSTDPLVEGFMIVFGPPSNIDPDVLLLQSTVEAAAVGAYLDREVCHSCRGYADRLIRPFCDLEVRQTACNVNVRSAPDTREDNVVVTLARGYFVSLLDDDEYPDLNPESGVIFARVRVSADPPLDGYMALFIPGNPDRLPDNPLQTTVGATFIQSLIDKACCALKENCVGNQHFTSSLEAAVQRRRDAAPTGPISDGPVSARAEQTTPVQSKVEKRLARG